MANTLLLFTRFASRPSLIKNKTNQLINFALQSSGARNLYSASALGIENFVQQQNFVRERMSNISEKFREKMAMYSSADAQGMIFTEDLKNMVHIAETEKDLEIIINMMKKFNQQNKQLRFGSYVFGPVVMRLFHLLNQPGMALECFKAEELNGFFDQVVTYQILLDLLYENQKYNEILEAYKIIKERQIEGIKHPRNVIVLTLAACYKLNNETSWTFAKELWKELMESGHFPMRRATTFMAGLALKQNNPELCLEVLETAKNQNYATVRNLKVLGLTSIGRIEEAVEIIKNVLAQDSPDNIIQTFNKEVIDKLSEAVGNLSNMDLSLEFNKLKVLLERQGQLTEMSLDEQLCQEIQSVPKRDNRQRNRYEKYGLRQQQNFDNKYQKVRHRPGLQEMA